MRYLPLAAAERALAEASEAPEVITHAGAGYRVKIGDLCHQVEPTARAIRERLGFICHILGIAAVEDRGPCAFVLDHGRSRTGKRPGFNYSGSLRPARVTPARPVPDAIAKPDYFSDGNPAAEAAHPARI